MSGRALGGVVFDMDGILIDSEPLFRMAAQRAARDLGHEVTDEVYCLWMGLPPAAVEASVVETMGADFPLAAFRDRFREIWVAHTDAHGVTPQPGIAELLAALAERGVPYAVATSTARDQARRSLALAGLDRYLEHLVCGDEVTDGKPAPEIFRRAAALIDVPPEHCVALEDSEAGVRAAAGAAMLTIMVPDLHQPSAEVAALADYVLPSTVHAARVVLKALEAAHHHHAQE